MKLTESNVDYLFSRTNLYRVPLYQRHYVWNKKNWDQLWTDIKNKSNLRLENGRSVKTHFTGAIVIQPDAGKLEIIDGQQRLTTFQIILCAIRDVCKVFNNDTTNIEKTAQSRILNDLRRLSRPSRSPESDQKYKLLPRAGSDRQTFQCLVASEIAEAEKEDKGGFIYRAYVYFKNEIEGYVTQDHHKLEILLDTLIETILKDFVMVQIMVDSDDEPEKIFQTINGTGQALNNFDLLRNDLFLRAGTGTKREDLYKKHWQQFDEHDFWRREEGKVTDQFLRDFLKVKLGADFNEHFNEQQKLFDQYQIYCEKLSEKADLIEYENLVEYEFEELSRYAEVYQKMHDPNSDDIGQRMGFYTELKSELKLAFRSLKPFVLYITNELGLSPSELKQVFDLLESYAVRWILCTGLPPNPKTNKLLLDLLNRKKSFNFLDLWYSLAKEYKSNKAIDSTLEQLLRDLIAGADALAETIDSTLEHLEQLIPNFKKLSGRTSHKRKHSRIQKLGKYISSRIKSHSSDFKIDKLGEYFCEIWPSSEALLLSVLKEGMLPIVYGRSPTLTESRSQLERYIFMTYEGMRELVNYEIHENKIVGINPRTDSNEKVVLDIKEILFAFPSTAMSSLRFLLFLEPIRDDVKNQTLTSVPKEKADQVKRWLRRLYVHETENLHSKHWLLPDIEAIVVSRAGHVLQGTLKSFNDNAIYMQIEGQIVTVYMHGLHELNATNATEISQSKPYIFMTYDGMRELSESLVLHHHVIGLEGKEEVVLDFEEILFAFPATTESDLQPYRSDLRDGVKNLKLERVEQVNNQLLKSGKQNRIDVKAITRAGHVLQGFIQNYDDEAIYMLINGETVIVYKHGLHEFDGLEPDRTTMVIQK